MGDQVWRSGLEVVPRRLRPMGGGERQGAGALRRLLRKDQPLQATIQLTLTGMPLGRSLQILWEYHWILANGLLMTFELTFISIIIALITGVASALGALARPRPVRWLSVVVIEFCRNTPILVLIIWVHYALPEMTGIKTTAVTSSVIALVMQSTGYLAEEY